MRTYVRCVWANKATTIGYCLLVVSLIRFGFSVMGDFPYTEDSLWEKLYWIAMFLLFVTSFGYETMATYKRALRCRNLDKHALIDQSIEENGSYCSKVGYCLAIKTYEQEKTKTGTMATG